MGAGAYLEQALVGALGVPPVSSGLGILGSRMKGAQGQRSSWREISATGQLACGRDAQYMGLM